VARELGEQLSSEIGQDAIAAYSVSFCRWREAEKQLAESGSVVKVAGRPQENPFLKISVTAARQMRNFQAEVERRRKQLAKQKAKTKATNPPPMKIADYADDMEAANG
jgi:phage terminase small subunit